MRPENLSAAERARILAPAAGLFGLGLVIGLVFTFEAIGHVAAWPLLPALDIQMPGTDGVEATRQIVRKLGDRRPPIVALTANAGREAEDVCRAAGMDDHLSKPFRRDELVAMVHRWLKRPPVGDGRIG